MSRKNLTILNAKGEVLHETVGFSDSPRGLDAIAQGVAFRMFSLSDEDNWILRPVGSPSPLALRPIEFDRVENAGALNAEPQVKTTSRGWFHGWGKHHRQAGCVSESKPVAILELFDGEVVLADPKNFRFTDR